MLAWALSRDFETKYIGEEESEIYLLFLFTKCLMKRWVAVHPEPLHSICRHSFNHMRASLVKRTKLIKTSSQKRNVFLFFENREQTFDGRFRF